MITFKRRYTENAAICGYCNGTGLRDYMDYCRCCDGTGIETFEQFLYFHLTDYQQVDLITLHMIYNQSIKLLRP